MESLGNPGLNWQSLQTYVNPLPPSMYPANSSDETSGKLPSTFFLPVLPWCHLQPFVSRFRWTHWYSIRPQCVSLSRKDQAEDSSPNTLEGAFNDTVRALGLPYATDLTCGNPAGAAPIANTRSGNTRIDACKYITAETEEGSSDSRPRIPLWQVPTQFD